MSIECVLVLPVQSGITGGGGGPGVAVCFEPPGPAGSRRTCVLCAKTGLYACPARRTFVHRIWYPHREEGGRKAQERDRPAVGGSLDARAEEREAQALALRGARSLGPVLRASWLRASWVRVGCREMQCVYNRCVPRFRLETSPG